MRDTHRRLVQEGYDRIGQRYLAARTSHEGEDLALLSDLATRLVPEALVLDAGCGGGVPVMTRLVEAGLEPVGLDLSGIQLALARARVPEAALVQADLAALPFGDGSFEALVSYYAVIHVPRSDHRAVLGEFRRVLSPGGFALLCLGAGDLPEDRDTYLGAPMFWSHFDAPTNLQLLQDAGFQVLWDRLVTDPIDDARHLFALARRC
jgi:ubiquinone/menaquinone biosynthesis C-methylase UbiE